MKIMRRVVKAAVLGQSPGDLTALVNPEAVDGLSAASAHFETRPLGRSLYQRITVQFERSMRNGPARVAAWAGPPTVGS
jgi:hypothetical protein